MPYIVTPYIVTLFLLDSTARSKVCEIKHPESIESEKLSAPVHSTGMNPTKSCIKRYDFINRP